MLYSCYVKKTQSLSYLSDICMLHWCRHIEKLRKLIKTHEIIINGYAMISNVCCMMCKGNNFTLQCFACYLMADWVKAWVA